MTNWFAPSLISLFSFGLWGFFTKLSVEYIDFKSALIYQTLGVILVAVVGLSLVGFKPATDMKGFIYAVLTWFAYALGCLFYGRQQRKNYHYRYFHRPLSVSYDFIVLLFIKRSSLFKADSWDFAGIRFYIFNAKLVTLTTLTYL